MPKDKDERSLLQRLFSSSEKSGLAEKGTLKEAEKKNKLKNFMGGQRVTRGGKVIRSK